MKQITLLHTVRVMYLSFEERLREALRSEVKIHNILDSFFASNTNEIGYFSQANTDRLYLTLKSAQLTGADLIAVICSTLTPHVETIAPLIPTPIVTIDGRLGQAAIARGDRIQVLASAESALEPTIRLIRRAEAEAGRHVEIDGRHSKRAFQSMMSGDLRVHDEELVKMASELRDKDVVVFAQGSMAHMAGEVSRIAGIPVVTAPELCIQQIREMIDD
jgi:aspartate/glutamate racemase